MNDKVRQKALAKTAALMRQGEQPIAVGRGSIGRMPLRAAFATAAVSAVLSGGDRVLTVTPEQYFFLLTDQRLLILHTGVLYGPTGRIAAELPRANLVVDEWKPGFVSAIQLSSPDERIRLRFPRSDQKDAAAFAAALGVPVA